MRWLSQALPQLGTEAPLAETKVGSLPYTLFIDPERRFDSPIQKVLSISLIAKYLYSVDSPPHDLMKGTRGIQP